MSGSAKQVTKKKAPLQMRRDAVIQHAKLIRSFGIVNQGHEEAVKYLRSVFYQPEGNVKHVLTDKEIAELLNN